MDAHFSKRVRLKEFEIKAILQCFARYFLLDDHLWVFGSRADIQKKGGDIDLYIETKMNSREVYKAKMDFLHAVCDKIGDQKIDIVVHLIDDNIKLPIYMIAKTEGVQLV
ncbi:MAG TPA: nucleotidyltransferase domain-containing protein [Gammaproteobacteria bacterium]|nr:nucleotidyltransferase domain-containing protein [Gammaproteobacteria bacterium]HQZ87571.1 nucleotidyltransferase domain-containing protein [Gammaproteobacteria bacterium]HRA42435.1 nucleotidyltransferase domain-containing protein [Gammaproteobacteria bacterium]